MPPRKRPAAQKSGAEKKKIREAKEAAAARAAKRARKQKEKEEEEAEEDEDDEYEEEEAEEEEPEEDDIVELPAKASKKTQADKKAGKPRGKEKGAKPGSSGLGRFVEPDRDDFEEAYEAGLKRLKRGFGLNVQCLDAADVVIGEVLFEVLDVEDHQGGAIIEAKCLARKGTTPRKSKLAARGSGVLVHLCMKPGCRKVPTALKGAEWLHFGSWRAVAGNTELPTWMRTKSSAEWRKHAPEAQKKESKGGKDLKGKGRGPKKKDRDKPEKKTDSRAKESQSDKSSAVMSRLREKLQELDMDDQHSGAEEDPSEEAEDDDSEEEKAAPKESKKTGKITVEELKDRLKEAREKLREKREEQEKKKKEKRKPKTKKVTLLESLRAAKEKRKRKSSEDEASEDADSSDSDSESANKKKKKKKKESQHSSQRKRKKKKKEEKTKKKKKNRNQDEDIEEASAEESSSNSDSDSECEGLFRSAGRRENGLASKIARIAKKYPGRLMKKTIQSMYQTLHPGKATAGCPPVLNKFLQQAMVAQGHLEGRNLRELQTIALAGDAILKGQLEEGLEILLQRWKRVEAVATGALTPRAAEHLELLPPTKPTALSVDEREECAELNRRWTSLGEKAQGRSSSPS